MRYLLSLLLFFFFIGCSDKTLQLQQTKLILLKSPKIKFHDIGYIQTTSDTITLSLYSAGVSLEEFSIGYMVCTHSGCITKSRFNKEFLNAAYPTDTMENILQGKAIFDARNLKKLKNGFVQKISSKDFDIFYEVQPHVIFFKDRKNHIIIKLKDFK